MEMSLFPPSAPLKSVPNPQKGTLGNSKRHPSEETARVCTPPRGDSGLESGREPRVRARGFGGGVPRGRCAPHAPARRVPPEPRGGWPVARVGRSAPGFPLPSFCRRPHVGPSATRERPRPQAALQSRGGRPAAPGMPRRGGWTAGRTRRGAHAGFCSWRSPRRGAEEEPGRADGRPRGA